MSPTTLRKCNPDQPTWVVPPTQCKWQNLFHFLQKEISKQTGLSCFMVGMARAGAVAE
jgi:hypothetical protein